MHCADHNKPLSLNDLRKERIGAIDLPEDLVTTAVKELEERGYDPLQPFFTIKLIYEQYMSYGHGYLSPDHRAPLIRFVYAWLSSVYSEQPSSDCSRHRRKSPPHRQLMLLLLVVVMTLRNHNRQMPPKRHRKRRRTSKVSEHVFCFHFIYIERDEICGAMNNFWMNIGYLKPVLFSTSIRLLAFSFQFNLYQS